LLSPQANFITRPTGTHPVLITICALSTAKGMDFIMVFDKMKEILAEQFDVDTEKITRDTDLMNDLGADSLDLVELIMTLEEEYGVSATDESVYEHKTVGEISDYIETLVK